MSLHSELKALHKDWGGDRNPNQYDYWKRLGGILDRHPAPTVTDDEREAHSGLPGCCPAHDAAQLQVQAPVGDSPQVRENVAWVCINPDAPEHLAHSVRLKMEAWGTCDYQGHREVALENGVSDGEREGMMRVLRDHEPPTHIADDLPEDEFACCADAILAAGYRNRPMPSVDEVADHLRLIHFDATGCGTTGMSACSNCYGPSPMSAPEVATAVLALFTKESE